MQGIFVVTFKYEEGTRICHNLSFSVHQGWALYYFQFGRRRYLGVVLEVSKHMA
jgi:hypothetical protein